MRSKVQGGQCFAVAAALVALLACGDDEDATTTTTEPPATTTTTTTVQEYTVEPGDNLTEIAERFDTTVEALVEANEIPDPDVLRPGQVLTIPPDAE